MKIVIWLILIVIIQIITFNTIITHNEIISPYVILLATCLSLYTGIIIRE